jgi:uncharacterized protein YbjQ (UPF0145 family)
VSEWHGSGLPPSAVARIRAATLSDIRFSQLGVPSQLAVESCGLRPVGAVVGCTAKRLDWGDFGLGEVGCGYVPPRTLRSKNVQTTSYFPPSGVGQRNNTYSTLGLTTPTMLPLSARDGTGSSDYVVYADAANAGWHTAMERMLEEAKGFRADGVVDVELSEKHGKGEVHEFVVTGTAVRSDSSTHLGRPFTTTLSGNDVAKLMAAGWVPASIVLGLSVAIRHDRFRTRLARARLTSAREIVGISELVHAARQHARQQLGSRTREIGADGAILTSQLTLSIEERAISRTHHDIFVEARATASAIVQFAERSSRRTESTSVLPMT